MTAKWGAAAIVCVMAFVTGSECVAQSVPVTADEDGPRLPAAAHGDHCTSNSYVFDNSMTPVIGCGCHTASA